MRNGRSAAPSWYWRMFHRGKPAGPVKHALFSHPAPPCPRHVRAFLLRRAQAFFEADLLAQEEAPDSGATARYPLSAHLGNELIQRQIRLRLDQRQQKLRAPPTARCSPRLGCATASLAKALNPDHRRTGTDIVIFGRLSPRNPAFDPCNHPPPHVWRIRPCHRSASQNGSILIDSLFKAPSGISQFNRAGTCSRRLRRCHPTGPQTPKSSKIHAA